LCDCLECVVPAASLELVQTQVWMASHWKIWRGHLVQICPPGEARHAMDLRNRGHSLQLEVTCWPNRKHFRLTTGLDNNTELQYMQNLEKCEFVAIAARLNVELGFAARWVDRWRKEAVRLANINSQMRKMEAKPVIRKEGRDWRVRGMNKDGTYTSAQRKFRAWEDARRFVAAAAGRPEPVRRQPVGY